MAFRNSNCCFLAAISENNTRAHARVCCRLAEMSKWCYAFGFLSKFLKWVSYFLLINLWKTETIFTIYGHFPICYTNLCFFGYSCPRLVCITHHSVLPHEVDRHSAYEWVPSTKRQLSCQRWQIESDPRSQLGLTMPNSVWKPLENSKSLPRDNTCYLGWLQTCWSGHSAISWAHERLLIFHLKIIIFMAFCVH